MKNYEHLLSAGAIDRIVAGATVNNPVLQILGHKKLISRNSNVRYRLLLSDGIKQNSLTVLATQLNHKIINNELTDLTVVKITRYGMTIVENQNSPKRVMVICNLEILVPGSEAKTIFGSFDSEIDQHNEAESPLR